MKIQCKNKLIFLYSLSFYFCGIVLMLWSNSIHYSFGQLLVKMFALNLIACPFFYAGENLKQSS